MGLLTVGVSAARSVLHDQWRDYFYCSALDSKTLAVRGQKRHGKGFDNIITDGSIISVNDGQCMIIVEQGKIVDFCAEPGEFVYDNATSPSVFTGGLDKGVSDSFHTFSRRVSFGGGTGTDQRVYYFNMKEIVGNKYGTANPIPFRVVDKNVGLDVDISIKCFGEYSYRIKDPILFYKNVCGNVEGAFTKDRIDSQLKSELLTALQPAFAEISEQGVRYSSLPAHADEIGAALNDVLSDSWGKTYGIEISSFGVSSIKANEEDEKMIRDVQKSAVYRDTDMAAAALTQAKAQAMRDAAKNSNGAMMGFAGMNIAQQAGGDASKLYTMSAQKKATAQQEDTWTCPACGQIGNKGKFCQNCGKPRETGTGGVWTCPSCGQTGNTGKFCQNCGKRKPAKGSWTCPSCGQTGNTGKFCPNCGKERP